MVLYTVSGVENYERVSNENATLRKGFGGARPEFHSEVVRDYTCFHEHLSQNPVLEDLGFDLQNRENASKICKI